MNRKERRAIEQGKGRHLPMVEITDVESFWSYLFSLKVWPENTNQYEDLFIEHQFESGDFQDWYFYE